MKDIKNYLIALLAGLLVLTLSTQSSNGAPKTYDAVKLIQYDRCLDRVNLYYNTESLQSFPFDVSRCSIWKP